ncbi:MAG: AmmeMemoRadiSam system protein A [Thermoanaerobaculales bacterium]|jgi:AmmeMemoRadiSam system protein A|nr:AmmeMemoRadiSam system protein A [Thermoanaerobaculales bacterium]
MAESWTRPLDAGERRLLLDLARTVIRGALDGCLVELEEPADGPLRQERGAFVTLMDGDRLRGCIGHVVGSESLWSSVRSNAINAAFKDPRFPPLASAELSSLTIEISALSPLRTISNVEEIRVGRDGLIVERGHLRGLLLPQVGERYDWSPEEFLDQTCRKAGMQPGCWRNPAARISAFQAEVFSEEDFR